MNIRLPLNRFAAATLLLVCLRGTSGEELDSLTYNRDIRPILAENCFACHGLDSIGRQADLRLDVRDAAIESGALVPGDPGNSELIARIFADDPDIIMPPPDSHKSVTPKQRDKLIRWVKAGAPYQKHWALIPPTTPKISADKDAGEWAKNPIDHFVWERLQQEGLTPAEEAQPYSLFRRLHLDVTGLPPAPKDCHAFVSDYQNRGDQALSDWIDRLMNNTAWGEHRARFWLDAARYADTHGMHFDNYREMWPYRDWVIRSFNRNQPFDQFTVEQLAGDLLDNPTLDQRVATGFQRCNMTTNEGGTIEAENLAIYASDRVQTFGWVFLGLTTNCCQCHDHKFDPITMKDYYSLAAFFRNTTQTGFDGNRSDGRGPTIRVPRREDLARWNSIDGEITAARKALNDRKATASGEPFQAWLKMVDAAKLRSTIPQAGQIAFVPLNEGTGNEVAAVSSTAEIKAEATGDLKWQPDGKLGPSVAFSAGRNLALGSLGDFATDQAFSHASWIRTSNLKQSAGVIARMDEGNAFRGWDLYFQNGQLAVHLVDNWPGNSMKVATTSAIKKNEWTHVCATYDGSGKPEGIRIFFNGQQQPTRIENNTIKPEADIRTTTPLRIGQRSRAAVFNGSVQDFRLFDRVLAPQEIVDLGQNELLARVIEKNQTTWTADERSDVLNFYLQRYDNQFPKLQAAVDALVAEKTAIESRSPITHVQVEKANQPAMASILMRGQYDQVGDEVSADTPAALHPMPPGSPKNRLGLARWVIDPANPITARVTVNRFWQEIFGQGIVATSEDFGVMGTPPSNQELLDWLATDFVASGWDVKRFFKQILMSSTYRQAAVVTEHKLTKDRDNSLLSRGPRFRMDAEMIRDLALTASGLRSSTMFGPGVRPYQPTDIWNMVGLPGGDTRNYRQDSGEGLYRRSLYTFWKRMAPPPSLETFNAPNREVCTVRRERTNTPLQALVTLNDPQFVEAARRLAELAITHGGSQDDAILNFIAMRVLGRSLTDEERQIALHSKNDLAEYYGQHTEDAAKLIEIGESVPDQSLTAASLATWTMVCNQFINLDEALNK